MSDGTQLVRYDAMCHAIQVAHSVDEVKDIRDKAMALEMYARQARNTEAERQAGDIRLRAERRAGELSSELASAQGHRSDLTSFQGEKKSEALRRAGISPTQAARWEQVAAIPQPEFEADLADPMWRPSTSGLIERHEARERGPLPNIRVDDAALWLWGTLQDFEANRVLGRDPEELLATMLPHMKATTRRLAPLVAAWLGGIK